MSELLFDPVLRGPLTVRVASGAQQFAGTTIIAAAAATAVVSTSVVKSDSLIMLTMGPSGTTSAFAICVRTIVDGTSFSVGFTSAMNAVADTSVYFTLLNIK